MQDKTKTVTRRISKQRTKMRMKVNTPPGVNETRRFWHVIGLIKAFHEKTKNYEFFVSVPYYGEDNNHLGGE